MKKVIKEIRIEYNNCLECNEKFISYFNDETICKTCFNKNDTEEFKDNNLARCPNCKNIIICEYEYESFTHICPKCGFQSFINIEYEKKITSPKLII